MSDFTNKLFDATTKAHEEGRPPADPPDVLYHFTDLNALKAIVTGRKLRVSLSTALNDASEGIYGLMMARRLVREHTKGEASYEELLVNLIDDPSMVPSPIRHDIFPLVSCFCATDTTSSQWMHYGRNGRGVAIGFNPKFLAKLSKGLSLHKIDYDIRSQRRRLQSVIDAGKRVWESESAGKDPRDRGIDAVHATHITSIVLRQLSPELKDPAFSSEQEWRLLGHQLYVDSEPVSDEDSTDVPIEQRITDDGRLVPHGDVPFPKESDEEPIKSVVVGYSAPVDIGAVKLLLLENKIRAKVTRSEVPVR